VVVGAGSYGAYAAFTGPPEGTPVQFAPSTMAIPPVPGTPLEVAQGIAARLPSLGEVRQDGPVFRVTVQVDSVDDGSSWARADWEGRLFGGALMDQLTANGDLPKGFNVDIIAEANGRTKDLGEGLGEVVAGQRFLDPDPGLVEIITAEAKSLGFEDTTVSFVEPLQKALVIITHATDPVAAVEAFQQNETWRTLLGGADPRDFEGVYLEIRDPAEDPIYISGGAHRAGVGMRWARDDVRYLLPGSPPNPTTGS